MDYKKIINNYLIQGNVMQLATAANGQPWVCTVYYIIDDKMNIYWLSLPTRRHSREIADNNRVAVTVPIKFDLPVIGVQAAGTASVVKDSEVVKQVIKKYIDKYDSGKTFYNKFIAGQNQHVMYKFTPDVYVLFDEMHFPDDAGYEIKP